MQYKKKEKDFAFWLWIIFIVCLIVLTVLYFFPDIDLEISKYFSNIRIPLLMGIMQGISALASPIIILLISFVVMIILIKKNKYRYLTFYAISILLGLMLVPLLKDIFQRARPIYLTNLGYSFPSGHSAIAMIIYGVIAFLLWPRYKGKSLFIFFIPLLVGFSRLYLNLHWLSDVIGGFLLGAVWLLLMGWFFFNEKRFKLNLLK